MYTNNRRNIYLKNRKLQIKDKTHIIDIPKIRIVKPPINYDKKSNY